MIFHLYIKLLIFTFYKQKELNVCNSNTHLQSNIYKPVLYKTNK